MFIASSGELVDICAELRRHEWVALDTEFMRERTYYAKLCLVQVATPDVIACIDPLVIDDLTPLLDLVCDPGILKVLHAARQDMEVFHGLLRVRHGCGASGDMAPRPGPIFDTQIAASYLGYDEQIGYAALVETLTGKVLDKAHTRTDWSARPLSTEQRQYAEDDVRYLRDVYRLLAQALAEAGRSHWPQQDFAHLCDPELYEYDPAQAWQRVHGAQKLDARGRRLLRALAAWRELAARSSDLPRAWVISDTTLLELARRNPRSVADLESAGGLTARAARRWGHGILEAMTAAEGQDAPEFRGRRHSLDPVQAGVCQRLTAEVDRVAGQLGISPALLGPRRDIQRLVLGDRDVPLLCGWRRDVVGENLLAMLATAGP